MVARIPTNKDFFGRTKQREIFKERAKAFKSGFRQNIAVLGRPFIGKTSIIQDFMAELSAQEIIPIYAQVGEEPFEFFTRRFIGSLLYQYLKLKGAKPPRIRGLDDAKALVRYCSKALPKTSYAIDKVESLIEKKDFDSAYDLLLDLPRLAEADSGFACAVIIEQFDRLPTYKLQHPFSTLGKKIMAQRNTFYLVTSSNAEAAKQILSEKLQLLFGRFEIMELEEFDFSTSKEFLRSRLEGFVIGDNHLRFIINFTNGHPLYLGVISAALKTLLQENKKSKITSGLLGKALNDALFNPLGRLNLHFNNIIYRYCPPAHHFTGQAGRNKNGVDALSVLMSLSNGNYRFRHLAGVIGELQDVGLVKKIGVFNRVEDPLLRFWLKNVYHTKRMDFTDDACRGQMAFAASIQKMSVDFAKSAKEDLYEKIVGLFKAFKDDLVQIDQKRYKLPAFGDVGIRIIGQSGPYIIGHSKGVNWICQIHQRSVGEKQVSDFLKDAKIGKYKFHRKVLIVLNGMDDNAKLLSKESNIWAWNLKTLNLLLDLYGKHKVIIC